MADFPTEDWWWEQQLEIVENLSPIWRERVFQSIDAVEFRTDAGRISRRADAGLVEGAEIVPGGWDHEHCALCFTKISERERDQTVGFTDGKNWVCKECYRRYLEPRLRAMGCGE